ncbi:MAG: phenylacetate--CoA ligase family protein [Chloroflexi bacterium]|nr:phenylacetate--CoA ligase family protein [Chloroflexota bacterium]MBL7162382.1 phenylacetate--CoA ligase family protein [Anaerolineales bacterium]
MPFYQRLWKEKGVDISEIVTTDDLCNFPLVTKFDIQQQPRSALLSRESRKTSLRHTSGTTADPRLVFRDETARIFWSVTTRRHFNEYGVPKGATVLRTHSEPHAPVRYEAGTSENWVLWTHVGVPNLVETPRLAERLRADVIIGSPQQLEVLAQFVYSSGDIRPPKVCINIAERLDSATRQRIKEATGADVFDVYCSSELSVHIAFECREHKGFHTNWDYLIIEVLNPNGEPANPGEHGEVVVTDLCNYVSPVIRYRLDDIVTLADSTCSCGRALPLQILHIDGRATDQIYLQDGRVVNALHLIKDLQALVSCPLTLVQETREYFTLKCYEISTRRTTVPINKIDKIVSQHLGVRVKLSTCFDELPATLHNETSKFCSFISRIPNEENAVSDTAIC